MESDAKSFLRCLALGAALVTAIDLGLALYSGPIVGDLTRIGAFAERDFAPRKLQTAARSAPNRVPIEQADIAILGDSFSEKGYWQGELEALASVRTFSSTYHEIGSLDDWVADLSRRNLKPGTTVILETVEREFVTNFKDTARRLLVRGRPAGSADAAGGEPSLVSRFNISHNLLVGFHLLAGRRTRFESGGVVNVALSTTERFSNASSDRLLYYADDDAKARWSTEDVAQAMRGLAGVVQRLRERGLRVLVLLIPDKSTVYSEDAVVPIAGYHGASAAIFAAGYAPFDLLARFQEARAQAPDLYQPNDTHLSPDGYRMLARLIAAAL